MITLSFTLIISITFSILKVPVPPKTLSFPIQNFPLIIPAGFPLNLVSLPTYPCSIIIAISPDLPFIVAAEFCKLSNLKSYFLNDVATGRKTD